MPWPSALPAPFMPMALVPGPLAMITGPTGIVVASTPWMLNSSLQIASTAVITHGRYSGRHPAMTAAMAIFSTVTSTRSGGTVATMSWASRLVPSSMRSTRSSVGGTTGSPSVQPRENIASNSSSSSASSTRRECSRPPSKRTRSSSTRSGSTLSEPQPGPHDRQVLAEPVEPGDALPLGTRPADGALELLAVDDADQRRHGLDGVVPADGEVGVVDGVDAGGEVRVVLRVHGDVDLAGQVGEQRGHHAAGLALLLDDDDQAIGERFHGSNVLRRASRQRAPGAGA